MFPLKTIPEKDHDGQNLYQFSDQNGPKTIPFGAAHIYIGSTPPPPSGVKSSPFSISYCLLACYVYFAHHNLNAWNTQMLAYFFKVRTKNRINVCKGQPDDDKAECC